MKQISIKKMTLTRFKGAGNLVIDFDPSETNIFGANGTGKTTVFDGFLWPLFDRDSSGQSDFNIKTLDASGKPASRVGHEVELLINVDGEDIEIRRVYAEKWVKEKGAEVPTFKGNENTFFWNGVPLKQVDFKKNVAAICDEQVFKLITSPLAFNLLPWKDRRDLLTKIAGNVSDVDIAGENPQYRELITKLTKYKSEEDYKAMLRASVEKSKKEIKLIPARIDEVKRSRPEPLAFDRIRELIIEKQKQIKELDEQIEDSTKAYQAELDKINDHNRSIAAVKSDIDTIEISTARSAKKATEQDRSALTEANNKFAMCDRDVKSLRASYDYTQSEIASVKARIDAVNTEISELRNKWTSINAEECHDSTTCPSCQQSLPAGKVTEIMDRFKADKASRLANNNEQGKTLSQRKADLLKRLTELENSATELEASLKNKDAELASLKSDIVRESELLSSQETLDWTVIYAEKIKADKDYQEKSALLKKLEESKPELPVVNNQALKESKQGIANEIDSLKSDLLSESLIKQTDARVLELEAQEKTLAQEIAGVDREIFTLEEFTKLKVDEIERRVRDKFSMVSFRMFRDQVNGGIEPCCDTLVNGVPFNDVNTAGKINAGIDIINTLSKFFGVSAPIFIDNRESITDIIDTDSQIVNLVVSPAHSALTIESAHQFA